MEEKQKDSAGDFPLVSVIIPVYNVAPYLRRCLDSILRQTYTNLEILLIDDGSSDESGAICDEYVRKDARVSVIHKKNGGLSDARNVGIKKAVGEYVSFVDSDDYVADHYLELLLRKLQQYQADLSVCGYLEFNGTDAETAGGEASEMVLDRETALANLLYQKYYTTSACGRLYRRELWKDIRFPKDKLYEDLAVIYRVFAKSNKVVYLKKRMYYYFQRPGSIIRSFDPQNALDRVDHAKEIMVFIDKNEPSLKKAAASRLLASAVLVLDGVPAGKAYPDIEGTLKQEIRKTRKTVLWDSQARTANRLAALFSYFGLPFLRLAGRTYSRMVHVTERK